MQLLSILLGLIIVALIKLINPGRKETPEALETPEAGGLAETYDDRVRDILKAALESLKRQGAGGFGPWIPSILDGGPQLYIVKRTARKIVVEREWTGAAPAVALTAIRFTLDELAGGRFNLDGLLEAESALMRLEAGE